MEKQLIKRELYLKKIRLYRDKQIIKVVSGIRRSGKSTLLMMFADELQASGVSAQQIIRLNLEDIANRQLLDPEKLYEQLTALIQPNQKNYIFLDEIQNVPGFERVVDSLFIKDNVDLYITGSNAKFLSSDLATVLTGRYIEIKLMPLSFAEYASAFEDQSDLQKLYDTYINYSSFPQALEFFLDAPASVGGYLKTIYDTIIYKDIVARQDIKNETILEDVVKYIFDNIGNYTNPHKIATYLTANNRKVSNHTVESYLSGLVDSFVVYKAERFDTKGKRILQTQNKYYVVDLALRRLLSSGSATDFGRVLENVVYLELLRRYDKVFIGKNRQSEIDFVAKEPTGELVYYQVALSVRSQDTLKRELAAFAGLDHHDKFLLTLDPETNNHSGIKQINALEWLVSNQTIV
jgi:predicted AAA+ superfamily ATPase